MPLQGINTYTVSLFQLGHQIESQLFQHNQPTASQHCQQPKISKCSAQSLLRITGGISFGSTTKHEQRFKSIDNQRKYLLRTLDVLGTSRMHTLPPRADTSGSKGRPSSEMRVPLCTESPISRKFRVRNNTSFLGEQESTYVPTSFGLFK